MICATCLSFTGISEEHSRDSCPVQATLRCRLCHCRGHTAKECGESCNNWERPTTLEELIPADIRLQWNISTTTELHFELPRYAEGTQSERKVELEVPRQDKPMREFMKKNEITTTHDLESNMQRIRDWAWKQGFRIRIVNTE